MIERRAAETDDVATTWVTAAELYFGAAQSMAPESNRAVVTEFLSTLQVLRLDLAAAQVFGDAKALLQRAGTPLADADLFIAAVAVVNGATVVTGNLRHFTRIPGVQVQNWIR